MHGEDLRLREVRRRARMMISFPRRTRAEFQTPSTGAKAGPDKGAGRSGFGLYGIFALALTAVGVAGILLVFDRATDDNEGLFEALTALDLLCLSIVLLLGVRRVREAHAASRRPVEEVAELSRAKHAAETANLAKSRYLANVSHEIRSPLNAIYGYAQLFERGDGVNAQEAARVILRCSEHLTNLVEGLLDISQLEFGMLRVRTEEVRLSQLIDQIVSMMRPAALSKGLTFNYEPAGRLPEIVRLDQSRFRQVLINLLSNAIKFTDSGSVTLKVGYSGQIATFEIRDTGPGIAPEDHERIFERFERVGDGGAEPNARSKPGAGLGLAIARTIVEILGGKLELESALGAGTCFRITMMMSEVAGKVAPLAPTRRLVGYEGRQRTILLVEDDADQRFFMEKLLSSIGFAVLARENGEAALDAAATSAIDLAILDISLPGLSGWEIGMRLRESHGDALQILMLSANSDEFHRPDFATPQHDRFLVKPVEFETLVDTVGGLLGLAWRWDQSSNTPTPAEVEPDRAGTPEQALDEGGRAHVARLREYLRIGYVRGIEAEIRQLEEVAPDARPLVSRLYALLDRYDLAGMAKLLQEN